MAWTKKTQHLALANPLVTLQIVDYIFLLSPDSLKGGTQVPTLTTDSASLHLYCLVLFCPHPPSYFLNGRERKKNSLKTIQS